MTRPRSGGRSARVVAQVLEATWLALGDPGWSSLSLARVAEQAGVHPATVYRRWDGLAALVGDAVSAHLRDASPLPDRGSLAADVRAYARSIADDLAGADGPRFVRSAVIIGTDPTYGGRGEATSERAAEIELMLARAEGRGESTAGFPAFFELVIAPLYGYALFAPAGLRPRAAALADRYLAACATVLSQGEFVRIQSVLMGVTEFAGLAMSNDRLTANFVDIPRDDAALALLARADTIHHFDISNQRYSPVEMRAAISKLSALPKTEFPILVQEPQPSGAGINVRVATGFLTGPLPHRPSLLSQLSPFVPIIVTEGAAPKAASGPKDAPPS